MQLPGDVGSGARVPQFATTHWSLVAAAQERDSPEARQALAELCKVYWYPLYAFIRRQGFSYDQAQDLTQEFFTRILEKDVLEMVDQAKGKFRSFLIGACAHFLSNERDRNRTLKRGGGRSFVSIDFVTAENRYSREPADTMTPERLFERRWALTLIDQVLARLREEFADSSKAEFFDAMKCFLLKQPGQEQRYRAVANELNMSEGAFKVAVHRLRQRYRELLREEISRTVPDPDGVEDEIRSLFQALRS